MHATWIYIDGHLVANQPNGALWARWLADESLGRPLADLLNQAPGLSRLLLPPLGRTAE
jgi:hypothetical protein